MPDYIPRQDAKFNDWQTNLINIVASERDNWGIGDEEFNGVQDLQNSWNEKYAIASNQHNRTEADVTAKAKARTDYEKELRTFVKRHLAFNANVSDTDRDRMGLTVSSGTRKNAPVPATAPTATVDFSTRLRHSIHFRDNAAPGKGKPAKVHGCEIWSKIGDAPVNESELVFLGVDTQTPYTVIYQGDQQGKTVHYWLRWVNTRGECGPWSAPVSAVIA
ncbi:MAG: hypothetical protein LBV41_03570 [Cytophagaceae bacterium]|jgi:hypothetical protein|nr:hypothetical protein [Cytophagaceae bacterium]